MSIAFHPQMDGQTERLNQTIEAYLRAFVSREQDDWVSLLPMAEFAYNNSVTAGNGMTPFFANYSFHPATIDPPTGEPLNPASTIYAHWMQAIQEESGQRLEAAQEWIRRYVDLARKIPPAYQVGDLVMLNGRNIKTRRLTKKLDHKNHGPVQIEKLVSPLAVRLTLPRKWKIHNVFHVSLLEPYRTCEHRAVPDPSKVLRETDDIEQSEEYDVEEVMSSVERGRHQEKKSASGRAGCVRTDQTLMTLWMYPGRAHTAPNAKRTGNVNSDAAGQGTMHLDAVCQGAVRPDAARHGICLPDGVCQGIFLLDAAVSGHFPSGRSRVRANGVRTTHVMAPRSHCLSRHGTS